VLTTFSNNVMLSFTVTNRFNNFKLISASLNATAAAAAAAAAAADEMSHTDLHCND